MKRPVINFRFSSLSGVYPDMDDYSERRLKLEAKIQILFKDSGLIKEMFNSTDLQSGEEFETEIGCKIVVQEYDKLRSQAHQILEFILTWVSGVSVGLISNWLYDKIKDRNIKITINQENVEISEDKIKASFTRIVRERE